MPQYTRVPYPVTPFLARPDLGGIPQRDDGVLLALLALDEQRIVVNVGFGIRAKDRTTDAPEKG